MDTDTPDACLVITWSGWPDLNRRPLRPELAAVLVIPSDGAVVLDDDCHL
jgi:hypothetical protein